MKNIRRLLVLLAACQNAPVYPPTRLDPVTETLHGVEVQDPYRWLEDGASPDVQAWADAQNALTRSHLDRVPGRDGLRARIEELASIGRVFSPVVRGEKVFFQKREGAQNQPVLYVRDGGGTRVALDPNTFSKDGTVALDWWQPSRDGSILVYGRSEGGSEESTLHITNSAETIPNCRAADVAWLKDNSGFYYTRYPKPGSVPKGEEKYNRKVYFHKVGFNPDDDPLVYAKERAKEDWAGISLSPCDRWLVVAFYQGWSKSEIYLLDRTTNAWLTVVEGVPAMFSATVLDGRVYVITNDGAPRYRVMTAEAARPARADWKELLPQSDASLEEFAIVGGRIVTRELVNASSRLRVWGLDGKPQGEIALPTVGSISQISGEPDGKTLVFDFRSFFVPPSLYIWDGTLRLFEAAAHTIDTSRFDARQVWYPSKDGTKISMFLVHKKGLALDGRNPVLLDGYGGFAISITPYFSSGLMVWIERGGVMALPNLRGGGEYGEDWHQAGMLSKKQNVFDDMISAAEWLIRERFTSADRLAISGGSNGGLLMGAMMTQRPELFRAVICAVPLLDMIRFHKFLIARLWIPEYGDPEKAEDFKWLYAYSPYHRVKDGTAYPATLIMTADTDTRVDPLHARKMAARLQAATSSKRPILLRVEKKAGHGAGKPRSKQVEELTDEYSFLFRQLGMN